MYHTAANAGIIQSILEWIDSLPVDTDLQSIDPELINSPVIRLPDGNVDDPEQVTPHRPES